MSSMVSNTVKISVRGKWMTFPAMEFDGKTIFLKGTWIKVAAIHTEEWLETELEDPERCVEELKGQTSLGRRPDILTFTQKLPATFPKYDYPIEWDSIAAA